jgi:hypothetical protein
MSLVRADPPRTVKALYFLQGFASGFQTLDDNTEIVYQISEFYQTRLTVTGMTTWLWHHLAPTDHVTSIGRGLGVRG